MCLPCVNSSGGGSQARLLLHASALVGCRSFSEPAGTTATYIKQRDWGSRITGEDGKAFCKWRRLWQVCLGTWHTVLRALGRCVQGGTEGHTSRSRVSRDINPNVNPLMSPAIKTKMTTMLQYNVTISSCASACGHLPCSLCKRVSDMVKPEASNTSRADAMLQLQLLPSSNAVIAQSTRTTTASSDRMHKSSLPVVHVSATNEKAFLAVREFIMIVRLRLHRSSRRQR